MTDTAELTRLGGPVGADLQPLMAVEWLDRNELFANDYNPNKVAPPEMKLLKISILSDGWTQPIVARASGQIVDGFHRWTVSGDPEVAAMTGGLVPVVRLHEHKTEQDQMMSTVRHNRARGSHHVLRMADIVAELQGAGMDDERIGELMQMDEEEVRRLAQRGNMRERHSDGEFSQGFRFVGDAELDDTLAAKRGQTEEELAAAEDDGRF